MSSCAKKRNSRRRSVPPLSVFVLAALILPRSIDGSGDTEIFEDEFERSDSDQLGQAETGGSWTEISKGNNANDADIFDEKLQFYTDDTDRQPVVANTFSPVSSGILKWKFTLDWTRGGNPENWYSVFLQLGNSSSFSSVPPDGGDVAGVAINLRWGDDNHGFPSEEGFGYQRGTAQTMVTTLSGSRRIRVIADLDAETYDIYVDGTLVASGIGFDKSLSEIGGSIDAIRIYQAEGISTGAGGNKTFDDIEISTDQEIEPALFQDYTAAAGLDGISQEYGVAWGDYNGDGYPDVFLSGTDKLYTNQGDGTFSPGPGLSGPQKSRGAHWGDYDNDGFLDLFLTHGAYLNRNNSGTSFTLQDNASIGITYVNNLGDVAWLDYDNDGDLDVFAPNGVSNGFRIYSNNGNGTFTTVTPAGLNSLSGNAEVVAVADYDNDGDTDLLYRLFDDTHLLKNNGDQTFTLAATFHVHISDGTGGLHGGGWGDYDGDGDLDLFLGGYGEDRLFRNEGNDVFLDVTSAAGELSRPGYTRGTAWGDFDHDCDLDLWVHKEGSTNHLWQNNGDGTFTDVAAANGLASTPSSYIHGSMWTDYDLDGDLDLFVGAGDHKSKFFVNVIDNTDYLKVRVRGKGNGFSPTDGTGTRVELWDASGTTLLAVREVFGAEGFGSQSTRIVHFGVGSACGGGNGTYTVKAIFTSGKTITVPNVVPVEVSTTIDGTVLPNTLEILEDQVPMVSFTSSGQSTPEGSAENLTAAVELSAPYDEDVIVPFTVGGSALEGTDYTISPSPVTVSAGSLSGIITLSILDDLLDEPDETVVITMGTPTNAVRGSTTNHTVTITDDDSRPYVQDVSSPAADGTYGAGKVIPVSITFSDNVFVTGTPQITLETGQDDAVVDYSSGSGSSTLTFDYTVSPGHATPDLDYIAGTSGNSSTQVSQSSDDAEEKGSSNSVDIDDEDLDLGDEEDSSPVDPRHVGVRFPNVQVPQGAVIQSAYVQFTAEDADDIATFLTIWGEASDNASPFSKSTADISSRPRTAASVNWSPPPWSEGDQGAAEKTPDISSILQEIVNRPGWQEGNAAAIIFSGTGERDAESYDGLPEKAPFLVVDFVSTALSLNGGTIKGTAGEDADLALPEPGAPHSLGDNKNIVVETEPPTIAGGLLSGNNDYADVTFSEGVYGGPQGTGALEQSDLTLTFLQNGGTAAGVTVGSVTATDGGPLSGGETVIRVHLIVTGSPSGVETVEIRPVDSSSIFDLAGNGAPSSTSTGPLTLNDNTPPTVTFSPADGAENVPVNTTVTVTFSESVRHLDDSEITDASAGGLITFQKSDGSGVNIPFNASIDAEKRIITVDPLSVLEETTEYTVAIGPSVEDASDNPIAGTSTTFTTSDETPPQVVALDPVNGATDVPLDSDLVITFTEPIYAGSGDITIIESTDGVFETIAVSSSNVTGLGTVTLTIRHGIFDEGIWYYVLIPAGALEDASGNDFQGFGQAPGWSFTTEILDSSPPVAGTVFDGPTAGQDIDTDSSSTTVEASWTGFSDAGTGIAFYEWAIGTAPGGTDVQEWTKVGSATTGMNTLLSLTDGVTYYASVRATDGAGNTSLEVSSDGVTIDLTPPSLVQLDPPHGSSGVAVDANLIMTFNEAVTVKGGTVVIQRSGGIEFQTIDLTDATLVSGSGTGTITVNPPSDLEGETSYDILVDSGSLEDAAGNTFDGVGPGEWSFTTGDITPPALISFTPADDAEGVAVDVDLTIVFDEPVIAGPGNVTITGLPENTIFETIPAADAARVTGAGTPEITVDPSGTLETEKEYYVLVEASAFTDTSGNSFGGLTSPLDWSFTTEDTTSPSVTLASSVGESGTVTNLSPLPVTVTFSEPVTGFDLTDVTISNGIVASFTGSGTTYTLFIVPSNDGTVSVSIGAAVAQDATGNGNTPSGSFNILFDGTPPGISVTSSLASPTNVSPIPVTVEFTEDVTGFDEGDIIVVGGYPTVGSFGGSGSSYTLTVTPEGEGTVTVAVAVNAAQDKAGNGNQTSAQLTFTYDATPPDVISLSPSDDATGVDPNAVLQITFNEDVQAGSGSFIIHRADGSTFETIGAADAAVSGSIVSIDPTAAFSGEQTYYVTITPSALTDLAGNAYGGIGDSVTWNFSIADLSAPTVALSTAEPSPTNASPIAFTAVFSEPVTGFGLTDIVVGNGTTTGFIQISSTEFGFDITPSGDGIVSVDIPSDAAEDEGGNGNASASQVTIVFDGTPPSPAVASPSASPTNLSPIPFSVVFDESVAGLEERDIAVVNGSVTPGSLTGSGGSYTFTVTPVADGTVEASLAADVVEDAAGNGNLAAAPFAVEYDATPPAPELSASTGPVTNQSPIPITVVFSENVEDFDSTDVVIINGTMAPGTFTGSGNTYSFGVIPTGGTLVTIKITANVAADEAGNTNTETTEIVIDYDSVPPELSISSSLGPSGSYTNASPIPVEIDFSEIVTGFDGADIAVTNGLVTPGSFSGSDSSYAVTITPLAEGTVSVTVDQGSAHDLAGNGNEPAPSFTIEYDITPPEPSLSTTAGSHTHDSPIPVVVSFSEAVTGFEGNDVLVSNGAITEGSFSGAGDSYSLTVTPFGEGTVAVEIPGGISLDLAGNENTATGPLSIVFDITPPAPVITSSAGAFTNDSPIPVTVTFDEPVAGLDSSDITVGNGSVSHFQGADSVYTFEITPEEEGTVTVTIAAGSARDLSGNASDPAAQFTIEYDITPPSVALSSSVTSPTNISPVPVDVVFSEPVMGFDSSDVTVVNGTITGASFSGSGASYSFTVTPSGDATVSLIVGSNAARDSADNGNTPSSQFDIVYDATPPAVTISSAAGPSGSVTHAPPITFDVTFSENVTGFDSSDVVITNGVMESGTFAGSGKAYSFDVSPVEAGTVTVEIGENAATDEAGNGSLAASPYSLTFEAAVVVINPVSGLTTTEAGDDTSFSMVLGTEPQANVTITLGSSDPTEGRVSPASVTFTPTGWNIPRTITVTGVDDPVDDGDQTYTVVLVVTSEDPFYNGLNITDVPVVNADDDTAGFVISSVAGLITSEGGEKDTVTLALTSRPTADVVLTLTSSDTTEGVVSPASITWEPDDWDGAVSIIVSGVNDFVADGDMAYSILIAPAASGDSVYDGIDPVDITVTNEDDDLPGIAASADTALTTTELGGEASFSLVLTSEPLADVTVDVASSDTTEGKVSPSFVTFTALDWNVPRAIAVTGQDDPVADGDQAYTILTGPAVSDDSLYDGLDAADISVTNVDMEPIIVLSDTLLHFGRVRRDSTSTLTLKVYNAGTSALSLQQITVTDTVFSLDDSPFDVEPSDSSEIVVTFLPPEPILYRDTLVIVHNDSEKEPQRVVLEGQGVKPTLTVNRESLDYGEVFVNKDTLQTILITNDGNDVLTIDTVVTSHDAFTVIVGGRPLPGASTGNSGTPGAPLLAGRSPASSRKDGKELSGYPGEPQPRKPALTSLRPRRTAGASLALTTVDPGDTLEVEVVFMSPMNGTMEGILTIFSDDPDRREFQIDLLARAITYPVALYNSRSFGVTTQRAEKDTFDLIISNGGDYPLDWEIEVEGTWDEHEWLKPLVLTGQEPGHTGETIPVAVEAGDLEGEQLGEIYTGWMYVHTNSGPELSLKTDTLEVSLIILSDSIWIPTTGITLTEGDTGTYVFTDTAGNSLGIIIEFDASGTGTVSVASMPSPSPSDSTTPVYDPDSLISDPVYSDFYWEIFDSTSGGGSGPGDSLMANITFYYGNQTGVQNPLLLRLAWRMNFAGPGVPWKVVSGDSLIIDLTTQTITVMGMTHFSQWTIISDRAYNSFRDTEPPVIDMAGLPTSAVSGTGITVSPVVTDESTVQEVTLFYATGGNARFREVAMTYDPGLGRFVASIPGIDVTPAGCAYFVRARDNLGYVRDSDTLSVHVSFPSGAITTDLENSAFPEGLPRERWRLISIPAQLDSPGVSDVLGDELQGGPGKYTWRVFAWTGSDWADAEELRAGEGYWIYQKVKDDVVISTGPGNSTDLTGAPITLKPGWNLIGSPYPFPVDISLDQEAFYGPITYGGQEGEGWSGVSAQLLPWAAYAVYNYDETSEKTIVLEPLGHGGGLGRPAAVSGGDGLSRQAGWKLQIKARGDTYADVANYVGRIEGASEETDRFDHPEPPYVDGYVSVTMDGPRRNEEGHSSRFTSDIRSPKTRDGVWDISVYVKREKGPITVTTRMWGKFPEDHKIVLLDMTTRKTYDVDAGGKETTLTITDYSEKYPYRMKVIAGSPGFVKSTVHAVLTRLPVEFALSQNFPNPFNPVTRIHYALPQPARVSLKVYNLLGQEVATLVREWKDAGYYEVVWNGRDDRGSLAGAGVYIYRLEAAGFSRSRKMILLK